MAVYRGKEATFTYNSASVSQIKSVAWSGYTWDFEDATTVDQASDIKAFVKTLCDSGEVRLTLQLDKTQYATLIALSNAYSDDSTAKTWEIGLPQTGTGGKLAGSGRITSFGNFTAEPGNLLEHEITIKVVGDVTFTAGS